LKPDTEASDVIAVLEPIVGQKIERYRNGSVSTA